MTGRNLKALSIDDDSDGSLISSIDPYIFDMDGAESWRIDEWATALKLWSKPGVANGPDLILGDVLFEFDETTPFCLGVQPLIGETEEVSVDTPIPTGLSHLKPFAALARAAGRPIGIAIHTRNVKLWRRAWQQSHTVGFLAAHEIGELAAILGDNILAPETSMQAQRCFDWLEAKRAHGFEEATRKALKDYRRKLLAATSVDKQGPSIIVPPDSWVVLYEWTKARCARGGGKIPDDVTVKLLYANGTTDEIRLQSIFADVWHLYDDLPAECFDPEATGYGYEAWDLDADGRPAIGRFIADLGEVNEAYEYASELIEPFSVFPRGTIKENIGNAAAKYPTKQLVLGLAVLFQIVRWEFERYRAWLLGAAEQGWIPIEVKGKSPYLAVSQTQITLSETLSALAGHCRGATGQFQRYDVLSGAKWPNPTTSFDRANLDPDAQFVIEYFSHLVKAKVLRRTAIPGCPGDAYVNTNRSFNMDDVPVPPKLPDGFVECFDHRLSDSDLEHTEDVIRRTLKDSLGYGKRWGGGADNWAAVPAILCDAFLPLDGTPSRGEKAKRGNAFLSSLLNGHGPAWLYELMQIYAEDLGWHSTNTLPIWLRR